MWLLKYIDLEHLIYHTTVLYTMAAERFFLKIPETFPVQYIYIYICIYID